MHVMNETGSAACEEYCLRRRHSRATSRPAVERSVHYCPLRLYMHMYMHMHMHMCMYLFPIRRLSYGPQTSRPVRCHGSATSHQVRRDLQNMPLRTNPSEHAHCVLQLDAGMASRQSDGAQQDRAMGEPRARARTVHSSFSLIGATIHCRPPSTRATLYVPTLHSLRLNLVSGRFLKGRPTKATQRRRRPAGAVPTSQTSSVLGRVVMDV